MIANGLKQERRTLQHRFILEPHHRPSIGGKPSVTNGVTFRPQRMDATVQFHDQPDGRTGEIRDVRPQRQLSPELQAFQSAVSQEFPEDGLGQGGSLRPLRALAIVRSEGLSMVGA